MKKIEAKIVADSINPQGDRITTYLLTFPRFILAELNTHRVFSKNSASSRAIPFEKMIKMVKTDPFIPIAWQKDHKGMQGEEYFTSVDDIHRNERKWLAARTYAVNSAKYLNMGFPEDEKGIGVTKQLCNRLLEPFMWHTVLLTGTEFENFFELRCPVYEYRLGAEIYNFKSWKELISFIKTSTDNEDYIDSWENANIVERLQHNKGQAEIHMQALSEAMWDAMNESTPKELEAGEYHIPFGDKINLTNQQKWDNSSGELIEADIKVATARCARLSYMTFDGEIDYEKDLKLHDTLLESHHMSPFEHCARAMSDEEYESFRKGKHEVTLMDNTENQYWFIEDDSGEKGWCNNFKGFIQYRYLIEKSL